MVDAMRFVIMESFDARDVNRTFEADISFRIGDAVDTRNGKIFRIKDLIVSGDEDDDEHDVRVLVERER